MQEHFTIPSPGQSDSDERGVLICLIKKRRPRKRAGRVCAEVAAPS